MYFAGRWPSVEAEEGAVGAFGRWSRSGHNKIQRFYEARHTHTPLTQRQSAPN